MHLIKSKVDLIFNKTKPCQLCAPIWAPYPDSGRPQAQTAVAFSERVECRSATNVIRRSTTECQLSVVKFVSDETVLHVKVRR